jgi:hypothetical protein
MARALQMVGSAARWRAPSRPDDARNIAKLLPWSL